MLIMPTSKLEQGIAGLIYNLCPTDCDEVVCGGNPVGPYRYCGEKDGKRIGRDEMNMMIALIVSKRSTCNRAKVGCVLTQDGRIISTGYGGSPSGLPHCINVGCLTGDDGGCIRTSHAEQGAIAFAARKGVSLEGSTMYVTMSPCLPCAKLIINAGIKRVVYLEKYRMTNGIELLEEVGISIQRLLFKKVGV